MVHESHSHQRHTEIAGFLAMVSGENAQTAAINGNGRMQTEFRREIGDGGSVQIAVLCCKPAVLVLTVLVEHLESGRVPPHIRGILSEVYKSVGPHLCQEFDGVVIGQYPEGRVDVLKQPSGLRIPTPPKIHRQFLET